MAADDPDGQALALTVGLGTTLISQRPALVNKSVLTQLDILVILRLVAGNDQDAVDKNYVSRSGTKEQRAELMGSLASLALGEAWIWEPGAEPALYERVRIRERHTFNSSATPKPGERRIEPKRFAEVDIAALKEQMESAIERAKADDPAELRKQITQLKKAMSPGGRYDPDHTWEDVAGEYRERAEEAERQLAEIEGKQLQTLMPDEDMLGRIDDTVHAYGVQLSRALQELRDDFAPGDLRDVVKVAVREQIEQWAGARAAADQPAPTRAAQRPDPAARREPGPRAVPSAEVGESGLTGPQRKLLTVLAVYGPKSKRQLAMQAGYSMKGGGFNNPLSALRASGLVSRSEPFTITDEGIEALGAFDPLPTGQALVDHWMAQLKNPEKRILQPLLDAHPDPLTKDALAEAAGYSPVGGGFNNPLSRLCALGLVERRPELGLTDDFAEAIG